MTIVHCYGFHSTASNRSSTKNGASQKNIFESMFMTSIEKMITFECCEILQYFKNEIQFNSCIEIRF